MYFKAIEDVKKGERTQWREEQKEWDQETTQTNAHCPPLITVLSGSLQSGLAAVAASALSSTHIAPAIT